MFSIDIKTIPHHKQKYDTVGNWFWDKKGNLHIEVSEMGDWRFEFLVAYHELAECVICKWKGIQQKDVDAFDIQFEKDRVAGKHGPDEEPGDSPDAPYRWEHFFATSIERLLAAMLDVDWKVYDARVMGL